MPEPTVPTIDAAGVHKRFGATQALDGLDLVVPPGELVALLGPNGAGKTTFIRTLATLLRPDAGRVRVAGHDVVRQPAAARASIGLAGQSAAIEPTMTGRENLEMVARLYGHSSRTARRRADEVIARLSLDEVADRMAAKASGGQQRRLDLAVSLVGSPRLLLLDEPTTGLDPRSRIELWDAIRDLAARGTDVLLTTQYLDEADQLASRVVIIDHGRVIADGTPGELKRRAGREVIEVHARHAADLPVVAGALRDVGVGEAIVEVATRRAAVPVVDGSQQLGGLARSLDDAHVEVDDLALRRPTLDEVFIALTGLPTDSDNIKESA